MNIRHKHPPNGILLFVKSVTLRPPALIDVQALPRTPVHDAEQLFTHVLRALQRPDLNKVLVAPGVAELVVLPRVVDGEQRHVIALRLVELGLLLVGQRLLVLSGEEGVV